MKTALFIQFNPMHPNVRLAGFETRRQVKDVADAVALAERMGSEFVGFDKGGEMNKTNEKILEIPAGFEIPEWAEWVAICSDYASMGEAAAFECKPELTKDGMWVAQLEGRLCDLWDGDWRARAALYRRSKEGFVLADVE